MARRHRARLAAIQTWQNNLLDAEIIVLDLERALEAARRERERVAQHLSQVLQCMRGSRGL
jgi:hypothetical protein